MAGCYLHLSSFSHFAVPSSIVQITQDQNVTEGHNVTLMCIIVLRKFDSSFSLKVYVYLRVL